MEGSSLNPLLGLRLEDWVDMLVVEKERRFSPPRVNDMLTRRSNVALTLIDEDASTILESIPIDQSSTNGHTSSHSKPIRSTPSYVLSSSM